MFSIAIIEHIDKSHALLCFDLLICSPGAKQSVFYCKGVFV